MASSECFEDHDELNDLDDATISYLLHRFVDTPIALELAKSSLGHFHLHSQTPRLVRFLVYDVVLVDFSENPNISWTARLGYSFVKKPTKPLFINFTKKTIKNRDEVYVDGAVRVLMKYKNSSHNEYYKKHFMRRSTTYYFDRSLDWADRNKKMQTWKCHVKKGSDEEGMLFVLKKCQNGYPSFDELFLDDANVEALNFFASRPIPYIKRLHIHSSAPGLEQGILRLVKATPKVKDLVLRGSSCDVSPAFYDHPLIRELNSLSALGAHCHMRTPQIHWPNFITSSIILSPEEALARLEKWKKDQVEINYWRFFCDAGGLVSAEELATRLLEDVPIQSLEPKFKKFAGIVRSKQRKAMTVTVRDFYDGLVVEFSVFTDFYWQRLMSFGRKKINVAVGGRQFCSTSFA